MFYADGQIGMTKLIVAFRNFAKSAPKQRGQIKYEKKTVFVFVLKNAVFGEIMADYMSVQFYFGFKLTAFALLIVLYKFVAYVRTCQSQKYYNRDISVSFPPFLTAFCNCFLLRVVAPTLPNHNAMSLIAEGSLLAHYACLKR